MKFEPAPDVRERLGRIVSALGMEHVDCERVVCFRSHNSSSGAVARIWSLPKIWQRALNVRAHYVVEVLAEKYDRLDGDEKDKTLIHELLHVPKTFSGAVVSHNTVQFDGSGGHVRKRINARTVEQLFKEYQHQNAKRFRK